MALAFLFYQLTQTVFKKGLKYYQLRYSTAHFTEGMVFLFSGTQQFNTSVNNKEKLAWTQTILVLAFLVVYILLLLYIYMRILLQGRRGAARVFPMKVTEKKQPSEEEEEPRDSDTLFNLKFPKYFAQQIREHTKSQQRVGPSAKPQDAFNLNQEIELINNLNISQTNENLLGTQKLDAKLSASLVQRKMQQKSLLNVTLDLQNQDEDFPSPNSQSGAQSKSRISLGQPTAPLQ